MCEAIVPSPGPTFVKGSNLPTACAHSVCRFPSAKSVLCEPKKVGRNGTVIYSDEFCAGSALEDQQTSQCVTMHLSRIDTRGGYGRIMNESSTNAQINDSLAFSIVWSPLPPLTWLIPFIGHTGIADSNGVISDFQGPYTVGDRGRMAFGAPTHVLKIRIAGMDGGADKGTCSTAATAAVRWDEAIQEANEVYRGRMHNLFCDNCHSHVACALNSMAIKDYGVEKWNMVNLAVLLFFRGRFVSKTAVLQAYGPFCIVVTFIMIFVRMK
jgi:transmembrane protein 222